jgi:hypothetical protein
MVMLVFKGGAVIYDLGNIADWLSGIGTIAAVITALYLAKRESKPKARVTANFGHYVDANGVSDEPMQVSVEIVNQGLIPIYLSECSIRDGKSRLVFLDGSHIVKQLLNPGEYYEHILNYQEIKIYFMKKGIKKLKTFAYFKDANNKSYKTKVYFHF